MKILLIGGFLGAGKTSLIRQFAKYLVEHDQQQVVIIENEVGEVGIDDKFLSLEGFLVRELFGGCICCQLTGELTLAVNRIEEEFHPAWIIIETTGIAKPGAILDTLNKYGKGIEHTYTIILADASRWQELSEITPELIAAQIGAADMVVINKIDEVDQREAGLVLTGVKQINGKALVLKMCALKKIEEPLLREVFNRASSGCGKRTDP
ncbi:GTP-binding protein [Candidatus Formimonas warabiya]|uniref:Cobalamin biosynthesis protein P47K n=1 Tax=Formimonas warabiya TaxID=1761012 RepID=A0A3G1KRZ9_FORW1|nr:GTP-binding protein [Candidatus Formimonas warabiya]ATW25220.1 cobalamin biosynthesis protein P47K [Candidatus Formimonas warabiya]